MNEQVPDSAGTATAFLCGVKAQSGVLGLDDTATYKNCSSSIGAEVDSILRMSKEKGAWCLSKLMMLKLYDHQWTKDMFVVFINVVKRTKGNRNSILSTKSDHTASMRFQTAIKIIAKSIYWNYTVTITWVHYCCCVRLDTDLFNSNSKHWFHRK